MEQNNLLTDKKWLLIGVCSVVLVIVVVTTLLLGASNKQPVRFTQTSATQPYVTQSVTSVNSAEVQRAIAQQMQVDHEYASWQTTVATQYPWLKKMPLTSSKYYVYFDLNKGIFIGRLYLTSSDKAEEVKAGILKELKEAKGVDVDKFSFEWTVIPQ